MPGSDGDDRLHPVPRPHQRPPRLVVRAAHPDGLRYLGDLSGVEAAEPGPLLAGGHDHDRPDHHGHGGAGCVVGDRGSTDNPPTMNSAPYGPRVRKYQIAAGFAPTRPRRMPMKSAR